MNKNAINAAMAVRRIRKLLNEGEAANLRLTRKLREISNDTNLSVEGKNRASEKASAESYAEFRALAGFGKGFLNDLKAVRSAAINDFRYDDPRFQTALHTISVGGAALPRAVQAQIVDDFRGNPTALSALKPVFEKNRWYVGGINKYFELFTTDEAVLFKPLQMLVSYAGAESSPISDAMGIDVRPKWESAGVADLLRRFETAFGVDTSRSPYVVELERMRDELPAGNQTRDRIETFLKFNGKALENDDPDAIRNAENRIGNGFKYATEQK